MNVQQVCNRFWRPATKTTFGSYTECWNILYSSGYVLSVEYHGSRTSLVEAMNITLQQR